MVYILLDTLPAPCQSAAYDLQDIGSSLRRKAIEATAECPQGRIGFTCRADFNENLYLEQFVSARMCQIFVD